ncbi:hypothetical protein RUM43_001650 [Polyplax serrata]|uniref:Protein kinase SIK1/2/3 UBA domain-containing protein n=1 Tax=Polyplax serrata TaxID=468196 RepID=A0AAN8SF28_POLSC
MLVVDPSKRYSIESIKRHRWMQAEVPKLPDSPPPGAVHEPNDQILRLMQSLGIDSIKTKESLQCGSYDHHAAIYYLLLERLRQHRQEPNLFQTGINTKEGISRRRPSSIAEQAMRKIGTVNVDSGRRIMETLGRSRDGTMTDASARQPTATRTPDFSSSLTNSGRLVEPSVNSSDILIPEIRKSDPLVLCDGNRSSTVQMVALNCRGLDGSPRHLEQCKSEYRSPDPNRDFGKTMDQMIGMMDQMATSSIGVFADDMTKSIISNQVGNENFLRTFEDNLYLGNCQMEPKLQNLASSNAEAIACFSSNGSSSPIPQDFYNALQMNLQITCEDRMKPDVTGTNVSQANAEIEVPMHTGEDSRLQEYAGFAGASNVSQDVAAIKQMNQQFRQELHHLKAETQQFLFQQSNALTYQQKNLNWQTLLHQSNKLLKENFQILQQQCQLNKRFEEGKQLQISHSAQNFNEKTKGDVQEDIGNFMDIVRSQNEITQKPYESEHILNMSKDLEAISETESDKSDQKNDEASGSIIDGSRFTLTRTTANHYSLSSGSKVKADGKTSGSISHQQYSSSTDEGIETDIEDSPASGRSSGTGNHQRLTSFPSSCSGSGGVHQKSLSQYLSSDSSCSSSQVSSLQSNFSTFESSLDYQIDSELASSLPSCTSPNTTKSFVDNPVVSTSTIHPGLYVTSMKPLVRHNPLTGNGNRNLTRSPIDFREGRRASDGLVAQQVIGCHQNLSTTFVAFNSQKLNETGKSKGVTELHLVQQEHEVLKNMYQTPSQEEQCTRQMQHSQYHQIRPLVPYVEGQTTRSIPQLPKRISLPETFLYNQFQANTSSQGNEFININEPTLTPPISGQQTTAPPKTPPLQQQLMQHRLLQQKRHILQKQNACQQGSSSECSSTSIKGPHLTALIPQKPGSQPPSSGLSTYMTSRQRQMLRQASYKLAQQTPVLPPLPQGELPADLNSDLRTIAEDSTNGHTIEGDINCDGTVQGDFFESEIPNISRKLPVPTKQLQGDRMLPAIGERQLPTPVSERCERQLPMPPEKQPLGEGRQLPVVPCDRARAVQERLLPHQPGSGRMLPTIAQIQKTQEHAKQVQVFECDDEAAFPGQNPANFEQSRKNERVKWQNQILTTSSDDQASDYLKQYPVPAEESDDALQNQGECKGEGMVEKTWTNVKKNKNLEPREKNWKPDTCLSSQRDQSVWYEHHTQYLEENTEAAISDREDNSELEPMEAS